MRIVRNLIAADPADRGASAAIGNFDGVHLGHRAVIDAARAEAVRIGAPLGVVTFEPHPREVFAPGAPAFRLMNAEAKANRLAKLGIDVLYELPFDAGLAALSPEAFVRDVLSGGLGLRQVAAGEDFHFGAGRAGTPEVLARLGATAGIGLTRASLVRAADGSDISSTSIRAALSEGRPRDAAAMLGHTHRIVGEVLHGDARGRDLGYPTANIALDGLHLPAFGVYAVRADVLTGPHAGRHDGVASLGVRPMFGGAVANLETHIFDFSGDIYGAHLSIGLVDWLRPEATFDGLGALIAQMDADSARARLVLGAA
jgi:riboflavin kinase/FMN adenylyltransferase